MVTQTQWKVRYIDYPTQYRKLRSEILAVIDETLLRGDVMLRQQLRDFEANLAAYVGTTYAVGVSNCTDGLHLLLRAAGVGSGDEVITVSHTFVATAAAIHHTGAQPVLIDIGDDHNMDVDLIESAITPRTRAIMPVHLNGRLCRMDTVLEIAQRHNLVVIEDSAQAVGASYLGRKGGAWGDAGAFSFYPAKLLGAYGDGGAIVTSDPEIELKIRQTRDHGRTQEGLISGWSFNCRLDNLHAAILDLKLGYVPDWLERRRAIARMYHESLSDLSQLLLPPPPTVGGDHYDVFQNYELEAENRDGLKAYLESNGIETMIQWGGRGVHQFPALNLEHFQLPRTELFFQRGLMIPMHCELEDDQVKYVSDAIRSFYGRS